uniref:Secreted protein n=1 Tax=Trichogramma kaykai TaxID=54128 RepID=A0ABD2WBU9_9HYME
MHVCGRMHFSVFVSCVLSTRWRRFVVPYVNNNKIRWDRKDTKILSKKQRQFVTRLAIFLSVLTYTKMLKKEVKIAKIPENSGALVGLAVSGANERRVCFDSCGAESARM